MQLWQMQAENLERGDWLARAGQVAGRQHDEGRESPRSDEDMKVPSRFAEKNPKEESSGGDRVGRDLNHRASQRIHAGSKAL
jgi:hypothetical protein